MPLEGAQVQRNLHGTAMFFRGGMDDIISRDGAQSALDAVTLRSACCGVSATRLTGFANTCAGEFAAFDQCYSEQ